MYLPDQGVTLEPLRADHADAVLAFERENRAYFAAFQAGVDWMTRMGRRP